jgi:hypothetical protein
MMDRPAGPSAEIQEADECGNVSGSHKFNVFITTAGHNQERLFEIEMAVKAAFQDADFTDPFGPASPWAHTCEGLKGPNSDKYVHVIAEDGRREILGAVLCVPVEQQDGEDADPGWFFVAPDLQLRLRAEVVREILLTAHELMREAGFARVVTKMGTRTGGRLLSRHFGYVQAPVMGQENRWIRDL